MSSNLYCMNCGEMIKEGSNFCAKCGKAVKSEYTPQVSGTPTIVNINNVANNYVPSSRGPFNKWVALALCFFLGFFGAHKFYEGKIGLGIVYLLTFAFLGIGWFIDLIVLIFRPEEYYI